MDETIISINIIHCKIKVTKPPSIKRQYRIVKRIKQIKRSIELENRLTQNNIKNENN
jgi:hypothetical protein